ncbi:MAG: calcium-binding protein [Alphaproteobacteria bacterium]|nr:calcium-binding protein [Alphaproteobacteria bacterium]
MKTHTKIAIAAGVIVIGGIALAGAGMARGGFGSHDGHWGGHWGGHFGGPGGGPRAMLMEQFDANDDGKLSQAEVDETLRSRLAGADSNGDGKLDLEEFQPLLVELMRPKIVDGFQFLDADGDAAITLEEIERPVERIVSRLDRNDDGELTEDEMQRRHRGWGRGHHHDHEDDDEDDS